MARELFAGQAGPASDLYSLGATLLHLVTGHQPSAFAFDSGRIEVPDNLPTDEAVAGLIEAFLRPAPRDRPGSAAAARDLLTNPAPRKTVRAMTTYSTPHAPALATPRRSMFGVSGEPRFVHMGDPPRDRAGRVQ